MSDFEKLVDKLVGRIIREELLTAHKAEIAQAVKATEDKIKTYINGIYLGGGYTKEMTGSNFKATLLNILEADDKT